MFPGFGEAASYLILELLFQTYPAYHDRGSRRAVQDCVQAILLYSPNSFVTLVCLLRDEASKTGIAPSNAFVLTEWCSTALQICAENIELWKTHKHDLVLADAQVLELCASQNVRDGVKRSAFVVTRRALRKLLKHQADGEHAVKAIVSKLSEKGTLGYRGAVLLGVVAGVCSRLPGKKSIMEDCKAEYLAFWAREVVGSRSIVPTHIANALNDFFSSFVTVQDLETMIVPTLEKGLLRAPEVVLNDLVRPLVLSLPRDIDLSELLANRLLKPLLSNIKSTNVDIRNRVLSTFGVLVDRSHNENALGKVSNDILTPLASSKLASAEQRVLHSRMLSLLPYIPSLSTSICDALAKIASKEPSEFSLLAESSALTHHLVLRIVKETTKVEGEFDTFVRGLGDKRPAFQRVWALQSGNLFWEIYQQSNADNASVLQAVKTIVPKLVALLQEAASNPLPAAQTGIIVSGYVVVSLHEFFITVLKGSRLKSTLDKTSVFGLALALSPKPSFLLNYKAYMKISSEEELKWIIRALASCSSKLCALGTPSEVSDAWVQSYLYFMTASSVPPSIRKLSTESLSNVYISEPVSIGKFVVHGLWSWYWNLEMGVKESAAATAQSGTDGLFLAIHSICPPVGKTHSSDLSVISEVIQAQLVQMLVLCRPEILPRVNWIEMCLRVGQDPGTIAKAYDTQCIEQVKDILYDIQLKQLGNKADVAAYNTFAELAFVAPDTITPKLVEQILTDLDVKQLQMYDPTDFAIARTPEGVAFVDVLSKKNQNQVLDKNARDYDTLKWEEEIRSQLAQKKGQPKRLTPDEQAKVNTQLLKEATIREKVLGLEKKLQRGIGIILGLATGPPTDADTWIGPSVSCLLQIINSNVGLLVGDAADQCYLACSNFVSPRLGSLRSFIGVATLRALGSSHLPKNFEQEPLGGIVSSLVDRA